MFEGELQGQIKQSYIPVMIEGDFWFSINHSEKVAISSNYHVHLGGVCRKSLGDLIIRVNNKVIRNMISSLFCCLELCVYSRCNLMYMIVALPHNVLHGLLAITSDIYWDLFHDCLLFGTKLTFSSYWDSINNVRLRLPLTWTFGSIQGCRMLWQRQHGRSLRTLRLQLALQFSGL